MSTAVVVSYQGSASSRWAVRWAAREAATRGRRLRVVVVVDTAPLASCPAADLVRRWGELRRRGDALAADAARLARTAAPGLAVESQVRMGCAVPALVGASHDAEIVVLGADRGATPAAGRGTALVEGVAAHARCPVVVVGRPKSPHPGPAHPVVVGVDGSCYAAAALDAAADVAARAGAPLLVVQVRTDRPSMAPGAPGEPECTATGEEALEVADRALERVRRTHPGVRVRSQVRAGEPGPLLLGLGERAGLLVLGRLGADAGTSLLLGSVSRAALRSLPCPVAVVGQPTARPAPAPSAAAGPATAVAPGN